MTLFERVSHLAKKQGKSLNKIAEDNGLSKNALYQWKTSSPKAETLELIANYFQVSTDYLLGRTDNPHSSDAKNTVTDSDLDKVLDGVMSFNGQPLTDKDREAVRIFLEGRKSK